MEANLTSPVDAEPSARSSGWRKYSFNDGMNRRAIHGSAVTIGVDRIFHRGPGEAHVSLGEIPPTTTEEAIGMHIHRDVAGDRDVEEWYIIVDGQGVMTFSDGTTSEVAQGDFVVIRPGIGHSFRAVGDRPVRLVSITPDMYPSASTIDDDRTPVNPRIVIGEVDTSMNPLDATCADCGAGWVRPDDDRPAATLATWARDHPCRSL
jgi:mannose-6-phosphate isomerase-like protein (cupin superfamily)